MLSSNFSSILLDTVFAKGLAAIYLTNEYAVLYTGFTVLTSLPVDIFTGMFSIILPATSLLLMFVIPCPVNTMLFMFYFNTTLVMYLFIK